MTRTVTDLRFIGDWGVWLAVVMALALAGAAWWFYRRETHAQEGRARWLLPLLRSAIVFFIVLILAGPVLHHRKTIGDLARVLVFVDASKSMGVTDDFMDPSRKVIEATSYGWLREGVLPSNRLGNAVKPELLTNEVVVSAFQKFDGATRWQRMESLLLNAHDGILPRLAKKHNVEVWELAGTKPERIWNAEQAVPLPKNLPGKPEGDATDLSDAIAERVGQKSHERCVVVLLSDGQHNLGSPPLETAKVAGGRNTPIFTVGVGAIERPADLAVTDVTAADTVFVEDRVRGEVSLKDDMPAGQSFTLKIEEGSQLLWEKPLITEHTHLRKVEFDFPIKDLVEAKKKAVEGATFTSLPLAFKVSIAPLSGEKDANNNAMTFRARAVTQRRKLLLLDGRPRWEFRYLRNMFDRDPQWEVNALVAGTELTDVWERGDKPGQFPPTREALFAYDLIGFGEVPPKLLRDEELEWIKEFVGTRGGGLFFVDGQREALRALAHGPLGALFPVEWLARAGKELPTGIELTERGAAFGPMRFVGDTKENAAVWRSLKPPHWFAPVKALPGAEVLLDGITGTQKQPVIVLRPFGAGKVLFLGTDETWRWRYDVADKYQDPFWHQMAAAVMEPPYAVRDKNVALDAGTVNYIAGDAAELRVRLRDDRGRAVTKGQPSAMLFRDGQKVATISLSADDNRGGAFRGKTGPLAPGSYEVRVDAHGLVPQAGDLHAEFYVSSRGGDAARELADLNCNEELLQQMARASGGEFYREEDARKLVEKLEPMSKGRIEESETILWQSWWWFVPIVGLLTVEWLLRKRSGLI
jgi:hypothetical protein